MRRIYVGIQHGQYFGRSVQFGIGKTFSLWRCTEFDGVLLSALQL